MIANNMICSTMMAVLMTVLLGSSSQMALGRSVDGGASRMAKLLAFSASSPSSSPSQAAEEDHSLSKRAIFDRSCKGIYDRELFGKLDRVCDDCYNLYRQPYVGIDCRRNCYKNQVFLQCLGDLKLDDDFDDYMNAVRMVGK